MQLERENAAEELEEAAADKRDVSDKEARDLWTRVNGQPGEILYAGEYKQ